MCSRMVLSVLDVVFPEGDAKPMAIQLGEKVPDLTLPNTAGEKIALSEVLKEKAVVLGFYHFAFTGG